jgi:hypothetical protein
MSKKIFRGVLTMGENIYQQGKIIERFGSSYLIEKVYQVSDEYMKKHNLCYKNRVTLRKLKGENGMKKMDFALTVQ